MRELKADQLRAFEQIKMFFTLDGGGIHLLTGTAGTGKTYLLEDVVDLIRTKGRVLVTAPTHKALKVLKQFIHTSTDFSTIHAALGLKEHIDEDGKISFRHDPSLGYPADNYTHIIVDEASMVGDELFEELLKLSENGKKILLVGDPLQIPPVNHIDAPPFNKEIRLANNIEVSLLDTIIRQAQGNPLIQFAQSIRENIRKPIQIFDPQEVKTTSVGVFYIKIRESKDFFQEKILPLYNSEHYKRSIDYIKVIAWRNKTVNQYNDSIRQYLYGADIPKIVPGEKLITDAPVISDGKILVSTNEEMEVLSCDVRMEENFGMKYYWTKVKIIDGGTFDEYMLRILHEESVDKYNEILKLQAILAKSYPKGSYKAKSAWIDFWDFVHFWQQVKYSYCITAHKSQGSTYTQAYVLKWDIDSNYDVYERNRILYTACTRPSETLYLVY